MTSPIPPSKIRFFLFLAACILASRLGVADEGLWRYNDPPAKLLEERYGANLTSECLERCQKATVRFSDGSSGAFVSGDGLVVASYQTAAPYLRKIGDEAHDFRRDGFSASALGDEKVCPGLTLEIVDRIEDVTARVKEAVESGSSEEETNAKRNAAIAKIEREARTADSRGQIVSLFGGAKCDLYRYKRYSDVRLVFAPEEQAADFGGAMDALQYPRCSFDVCFFRVYEGGKPAKSPEFLQWSSKAPAENDLVFVSGSPSPNDRLLTCAELYYLRDNALPFELQWLFRQEAVLADWSAQSADNALRAKASLERVRRRRKIVAGREAALLDPGLQAEKWAAEKRLREAVTPAAELQNTIPAWDRIMAAQRMLASNGHRRAMLEDGLGFNSVLFDFARIILRASMEKSLPDEKRLFEYQEANLAQLEQRLLSDEPIDEDLEILKLADSLSWLAGEVGASEFGVSGPTELLLKKALGEQAPRGRAASLIRGTKLKDSAVRKALFEAGFSGVVKARDPMVEFARAVNPEARQLRSIAEAQEEVKRREREKIAAARYFLDQGMPYPEADSTLRFSFGAVRGYDEGEDRIPYQTTLGTLFEKSAAHFGDAAYAAPPRWLAKKNQLDLTTPFNFVSTADIAAGFRGGAVTNTAGDFVGLVFDGNAPSVALDFAYNDRQARAVSLSAQAIGEVLRNVYDAPKLVQELETRQVAK